MKTKTFDCVQMKRDSAEKLRRLLESLTPAERRAFWEDTYRQLRERQAQRRQKQASENGQRI